MKQNRDQMRRICFWILFFLSIDIFKPLIRNLVPAPELTNELA